MLARAAREKAREVTPRATVHVRSVVDWVESRSGKPRRFAVRLMTRGTGTAYYRSKYLQRNPHVVLDNRGGAGL